MRKLGLHRRWSRHALCGVAAVVLVVGMAAQSARAADGDDDSAPDTKFFRGVLNSLGLRPDGGAGIDYRERSPLVVPPDRNLPAPESRDLSAKDPSWPKDVDLERARKAKAERKAYNEEPEVRGRALRPDEYNPANAQRRTRGDSVPTGGPNDHPDGAANPESPSALGFKGIGSVFQKSEEYVTFQHEPSRSNLTDPPAGYRTPSPNQPYGVGKQKWTPGAVPDRNDVVK